MGLMTFKSVLSELMSEGAREPSLFIFLHLHHHWCSKFLASQLDRTTLTFMLALQKNQPVEMLGHKSHHIRPLLNPALPLMTLHCPWI